MEKCPLSAAGMYALTLRVSLHGNPLFLLNAFSLLHISSNKPLHF